MSEWQPIETAPKDGTPILMFGRSDNDEPPIAVRWWVSQTDEWWEQVSETRKELRTEESGYWEGPYLDPSHWMPLPAPPTAGSNKP